MEREPVAGSFDLTHLRKIHQHAFQDIYPWAGELRTLDILKGDSLFAPHHLIEPLASALFENLEKRDFFRGLDDASFAEALGTLLGRLNRLHPFREGNGRTQRQFLSELARLGHRDIRWEAISNHGMVEASKAAFAGQFRPMIRLMALNLEPYAIAWCPSRIQNREALVLDFLNLDTLAFVKKYEHEEDALRAGDARAQFEAAARAFFRYPEDRDAYLKVADRRLVRMLQKRLRIPTYDMQALLNRLRKKKHW
jgi:cell filamentation protein